MKVINKFKKMDKRQKVEVIAASILSAALLISLPTYAWFASNKNLETITKIKEPGEMMIRAGRTIKPDEADPIVNFELNDINIESISEGKPQLFVFSVSPGDNKLGYRIQLAHTTNIPFTYKIYKANEKKDVTGLTDAQKTELASYHAIETPNSVTYYEKVDYDSDVTNGITTIPMTALNANSDLSNGRIAKQNDSGDLYECYSQTYNSGTDTPNIYAVPIYMQSVELPHSSESNDPFDYYILELGWDVAAETAKDNYKDWNEADNNKETDIIYITAKRASG